MVAGTGTHELSLALHLTRAAERLGAAAVLVITPYFVKPSQQGLEDEQYTNDTLAELQTQLDAFAEPRCS